MKMSSRTCRDAVDFSQAPSWVVGHPGCGRPKRNSNQNHWQVATKVHSSLLLKCTRATRLKRHNSTWPSPKKLGIFFFWMKRNKNTVKVRLEHLSRNYYLFYLRSVQCSIMTDHSKSTIHGLIWVSFGSLELEFILANNQGLDTDQLSCAEYTCILLATWEDTYMLHFRWGASSRMYYALLKKGFVLMSPFLGTTQSKTAPTNGSLNVPPYKIDL